MGLPDDETSPSSHPLFNPPMPETKVGPLREGTNWLWDLTGRIVGRSGDMRSVVTGAAMEFSDLVTQDISDSGEYNDALWRDTCMNLSFAAGVGDQWAEDVIDYKNDRARLVSQFETALAAGNTVSGEVAATTAEDKRRANLVHQFNVLARNRMDALLETGGERKRMLADGPQPQHVAQLVDAGVLGWAPYNILGARENPPLPVSEDEAKAMAADLNDYIHGGQKPDDRYYEIVAALTAIGNKAAVLQGKDDRMHRNAHYTPLSAHNMRREEIRFLETFYAELEDGNSGAAYMEGTGNGGGLLYLPQWLDTNPAIDHENFDEAHKQELQGALGDGLLVLSDEQLGGGLDHLPYTIRRFAEGEPIEVPSDVERGGRNGDDAEQWLSDAVLMNRFLDQADSDLRGGTAFSAGITTSMGHHLNAVDDDIEHWNDSLTPLLDVSTRNQDANSLIVRDIYDHPTFQENANAIKGLYTHGWSDDGAAVAGLTDWIAEAAHSGDFMREAEAQDAALSLIRMTTDNPDRYQTLVNTGVTVGDNPGASFGMVNPHIAQSLADVVISYQEDFSMPAPGRESPGFDGYGIDDNSGLMVLGYEPRLKFLEFIAADPDSAARLYHSLELRESVSAAALAAGETDPSPVGVKNGTLRALLDSATRMEALDRTENATDARQAIADAEHARNQSLLAMARTAAYAGTGYLGLGAQGVQAANRVASGFMIAGVSAHEFNARVLGDAETVATAYQDANGPGESDGQTYTQGGLEVRSRLDVLHYLLQDKDSGVTAEDVRDTAPELLTESGDVKNYADLSAHEALGTSGGDSLTTRMDRLLTQACPPYVVPGSDSGQGALPVVQDYGANYEKGYEDTQESIRATVDPDRADELRQMNGSGNHRDE